MNVNNLRCKDADTMLRQLKDMAVARDEEFLSELKLLKGYFESEAIVNIGKSENGDITDRMYICAQNASHHIVRGNVEGAIHEIWDIIDYHDPEDELTTIDIVFISLLLESLYNKIHIEDRDIVTWNTIKIGGEYVYFS